MFRHPADFVCALLLAVCLAGCGRSPSASSNATNAPGGISEQYVSLMHAGKNYLDQGDPTNALAAYRKAAAMVPNDADLHLNLANSHLLNGAAAEAIREADEVLKIEPNSAAAYFVKGSAYLRMPNPEEAVKALENSKRIDPSVTATFFQLGRARMGLQQWEDAITAFRAGIALEPNRLHSTAHYLLGQSLVRAGRPQEAQKELELHQGNADAGGPVSGVAVFERCKHTQARVPFKLEQPEKVGIPMQFMDATKETFGDLAQTFSGPIGLVDVNHSGTNSLFVMETGRGFRVLWNANGALRPAGALLPAIPGARYAKMLVGDLQNDRFDDIVVLGEKGSHLFTLGTNGVITDASILSRLNTLNATDGILMDLDFTGKLDLLAVAGAAHQAQIYRQSVPLVFTNVTGASGIPASLEKVHAVMMDDWNRDGTMDVIASRAGGSPLLLEKQRGGRLIPREPTNWVAGAVFCVADFDNDLRPDLAVAGDGRISFCFSSGQRMEIPFPASADVRQLAAVDHDNDGWLDLWTVGDGIRAWRNLGLSGFQDQTAQLGLDKLNLGAVSEVQFADFDMDCDSDAVVALANGGLRYLRNEGGNNNAQLKVRLFGTRSNASGIGCKIEIASGGLRLIRTVHYWPVEVGVGKRQKLDSFLVHWFNWPQGSAELPFDCREPIFASELSAQEGSCPYLYAWDGKRFRFVTDILGASPLGLPVAEGRYIEADPEEYVWIGDEQSFPAKDGNYQVQITEELREVLYLDEAKLVVVDHEPGTEVHPTDKLLPGKPYPPGALMTLHREHPLQHAETLAGKDVTAELKSVDGRRVSPPKLRVPQLRGLAEPHGLELDFGPLEVSRPLALVLNGWLRFGGGMANIAASHDPTLPFPFPSLEAEVSPGVWQPVAVTVGAPCGKTKTILADLDGKLPAGTRRLRLSGAFEIHWDRVALMEKKPDAVTTITVVSPGKANLHFRGFSPWMDLPADWPLTPDYERVSANSLWTITPGGWCTRYGDVSDLIAARDEGLALLNGGDELTLKFAASSLPPRPAGSVREFFLYADGWDKDSDFHVATGTTVEPLPHHGMDDQLYGRQKRPQFPSDRLHQKYNTRWVESSVLKQTAQR